MVGITFLPRYRAATEEVVPPQTIFSPSLAKNRFIILMSWSGVEGGPMTRFTDCRARMRTTAMVVSSPGWPP